MTNCCKTILKNLGYAIIACLGAIIFVAILNRLLQLPALCPIIGGRESETVWLTFWGSYLSAIGTILMGWQTWQTNKRHDKEKYILAVSSFATEQARLHSVFRLTSIMRLYEQLNINEGQISEGVQEQYRLVVNDINNFQLKNRPFSPLYSPSL